MPESEEVRVHRVFKDFKDNKESEDNFVQHTVAVEKNMEKTKVPQVFVSGAPIIC